MERPAPRRRLSRLALVVTAVVLGLGLAAGPASMASAAVSTAAPASAPLAATKTTTSTVPGMNTKDLTFEQRWVDEILLFLVIGAALALMTWRPEMPWRRRRQLRAAAELERAGLIGR